LGTLRTPQVIDEPHVSVLFDLGCAILAASTPGVPLIFPINWGLNCEALVDHESEAASAQDIHGLDVLEPVGADLAVAEDQVDTVVGGDAELSQLNGIGSELKKCCHPCRACELRVLDTIGAVRLEDDE